MTTSAFLAVGDVLGPAVEQAQVMRIFFLMGLEEISAVLPTENAAIWSYVGAVYWASALVLGPITLQLGLVSNYLRQAT